MLVFLCLIKMNFMIRILLLLCMTLSITKVYATDLFSGTISFKDNHWYFSRCSITKNDYLVKAPEHIVDKFRQLEQKRETYWVSLLADADYQENDILVLKVREIDEIHLKTSCHLLDAFEDIENRE
ncbi:MULTISPECIES: hypothetical protein [Acinetobacter calcoaceticus/baumannii complex]|uniref:hypothetical protein n=1 Tax=Acinetobacter calcoaceticus/baumannii complex TaxID=909768 RepID=UPI001E38801B|nr:MULTISPECIES: hypothetical protein [Acinetobacter calcoaceticus/baumannii complex]